MVTPTSVLSWAQVIASLIQIGVVTVPQVAQAIKDAMDKTGKTDVDYAELDAALSANTHATLQQIITQAGGRVPA